MSLLHRMREDKSAALAVHLFARDCLDACGLEVSESLSATCAASGVARSSVYENKALLEAALDAVEPAAPGRPRQGASAHCAPSPARTVVDLELENRILRYQLANPGARVEHDSGRVGYSDGFKRLVLDLADGFDGTDEAFCRASGVPLTTLWTWRRRDALEPILPAPKTSRVAAWPDGMEANDLARQVACDYERWGGNLGDFLRHTTKRLHVGAEAVRAVLRVTGMIPPRKPRLPRYRSTTERATPGAIVVTDGKQVDVELASGVRTSYNWQGIVDQATACHLGVVVTAEEDAAAVVAAHAAATKTLGKPPLGLVHDQKPIHKDAKLLAAITPVTAIIVATLGRPENKAVIEGEFGRFEREVGKIRLDDTSRETLIASAVAEVLRAYTAGIDHAPREELGGVSRAAAVAAANPGTEKDEALIARLVETHGFGRQRAPALPTEAEARVILDAVFEREGLSTDDPTGKLRRWLAARFTPDAIRRASAVFGAKRERGELRTATAHRYLVKLITSIEDEIALEREERLLADYAAGERCAWLAALERDRDALRAGADDDASYVETLAEEAVYASIVVAKAFWERELKAALATAPACYEAAMTRVRRLYEAPPLCRRRLLDQLAAWQAGLGAVRH